MQKHLIAIGVALATFAMATSLASAKPVLTHPTGTVLATGTKITATNVGNAVLSNGLGTLACSTVIVTGTLEANSTVNGIKGTITSAKFGGTTGKTITGGEEPECTGTGFFAGGAGVTTKPPYCVALTGASDTGSLRGGACTEPSSRPKFNLSVTTIFGTVTCEYESTSVEGLVGSFATDATGADTNGTVAEQEFIKSAGSGGECSASAKVSMSLTVETDSKVAEPVYVSS
jgi:hypothetical protein